MGNSDASTQDHNVGSAPVQPGLEGKILVVDDAESTVMLVKRIFDARPGYEVDGAGSGGEALEKATAKKFDLILLDLHLPDMNGDEVIRHLRAQQSTRDVPVVIVTADAAFLKAGASQDIGANGYFTKPFRMKELLELADGYIERSRASV